MTLDTAVQLHEVLEIHYYVDHYAAELHTQDGQKCVLKGYGSSPDEALLMLRFELLTVADLTTLRKLPKWEKDYEPS